ncbi:MAG: NADH-quinone oxidoreductase subunit L [Lachnospiraceae bacterium]|nr:NADH-quinone oxidoreductase subunit L [Lachnospiraceae bacterium]
MANLIAALIVIPLIFAVLIALMPSDKARGIVVYAGGVINIALVLCTTYMWVFKRNQLSNVTYDGSGICFNLPFNDVFNFLTLAGDLILMVVIIALSFKYHKKIIALLSIIQTCIVMWVEVNGPHPKGEQLSMHFDWLSCIMILIIGIVGSLIAIYAVGYMRGYHVHHKEFADRRKFFFSMIFVFYAAMFGLVTTQHIMWLECFWETTSVCSFLLIGYTKTDEAITNCFRALWMNLVGGLGFAVVILFSAYKFHSFNMNDLIYTFSSDISNTAATLCLAALAFAAISKTAQFPFSKWLLGAMVAPTPSSALLHSATMVKAGVYLLLRISPALSGTKVGTCVYLVGGFTFFAASLLAISQSDGKKVLAYSTISNLGLMVACAGIGTVETVWAAMFLMIFHAISKSMCFQAVGAIENSTHSRDIEDMQGLMRRLPKLALILLIGMVGMYLAPFGMLISKWAALKSMVDASSTIMVLFVCFGSASTMFYWTKWMSKLLGTNEEKQNDVTEKNEYISMFTHAGLAICVCLGLPIISSKVVLPHVLLSQFWYNYGIYGQASISSKDTESLIMGSFDTLKTLVPLNENNLRTMIFMIIAIIIVPVVTYFLTRNTKTKPVIGYMNGINTGDNKHFTDSFGGEKELHVSNWYMDDYFGEKKIFTPSVIIGVILNLSMLGIALATWMGGVL